MTEALMVGKKIKGRKRHISTDIEGRLLHVSVHAGNIHDTKAGANVAHRTKEKYSTIKGFSADDGYRGTTKNHIEIDMGLKMEISKKIKPGWSVLVKRWVVERTFAWMNNARRLAKDFEILTCSAENFVRISIIQIMLDRLC